MHRKLACGCCTGAAVHNKMPRLSAAGAAAGTAAAAAAQSRLWAARQPCHLANQAQQRSWPRGALWNDSHPMRGPLVYCCPVAHTCCTVILAPPCCLHGPSSLLLPLVPQLLQVATDQGCSVCILSSAHVHHSMRQHASVPAGRGWREWGWPHVGSCARSDWKQATHPVTTSAAPAVVSSREASPGRSCASHPRRTHMWLPVGTAGRSPRTSRCARLSCCAAAAATARVCALCRPPQVTTSVACQQDSR